MSSKIKEKTYLKDKYARKLLNAEECQEFVISIVSVALDLDKDYVRKNFHKLDPYVSRNVDLKNQETDVLFENDMMYCNIEINYNFSENLDIKNQLYIGNLMVRQIHRGEDYSKFKKIIQINLNGYDLYKKDKFIYRSSLMEESIHEKRNDMITILDINLDSLSQSSYNEIRKLNELDLKWLLYLFVCEDSEERENMYQDNPMMRGVIEKMKELEESLNELLYYDHEKFERDAMYDEGKRVGIFEGRKVGEHEKQVEVAKKMLQKDMEMSLVLEISGLSQEEIADIQRQMDNTKDS